jgi:hypothetical protein
VFEESKHMKKRVEVPKGSSLIFFLNQAGKELSNRLEPEVRILRQQLKTVQEISLREKEHCNVISSIHHSEHKQRDPYFKIDLK